METRRLPITRTISKTPSAPRLRWPVSENCRAGRSPTLTANSHHAESSDHCDCAAAEAHHRAAIPATTATQTARPMVPGGLDGERQLLHTGLRQGARRYRRLARGRQLLHPLKVRDWRVLATPAFSCDCHADDVTRSGSDGQIFGESRTGGKAAKKWCVDLIEAAWHRRQRIGHKSPRPAGCRGGGDAERGYPAVSGGTMPVAS